MTVHLCAHPLCDVEVPFERLACREHWFDLPRAIRIRVTSTWRRQDMIAHRAAVSEALAWWTR